MTEVVHADIFFLITAVAVIAISALAIVVLYYAIGIVRDLRAVVAKLRHASDEIEGDFEQLRQEVKTEGTKIKTLFDFFIALMHQQIETPRKRPIRRAPPSGEALREE